MIGLCYILFFCVLEHLKCVHLIIEGHCYVMAWTDGVKFVCFWKLTIPNHLCLRLNRRCITGCNSYIPLIVTVNMIAECLRTDCNILRDDGDDNNNDDNDDDDDDDNNE